MGSLIGHVLPGVGFFLIGLWHLFNHIKLHSRNPHSYKCPVWFPTPSVRHLELYVVMVGSCVSIVMELFVGPSRHEPLDTDGTIPSYHLHTFEHSSISLSILVYSASALALDRTHPPPAAARTMALLVGAVAFAQEYVLFHLHSTDHMGVEGQFHALLQTVIAVSVATTLAGIGHPRSFAVSFVRSASIMFQGVWFNVMGVMLWTPGFISKGCFIHEEDGRKVVRCDGQASLHRAKSLVNLQFSWYLTGMAIFSLVFYLFLTNKYPTVPEYLVAAGGDGEEEEEYLESSVKEVDETQSFISIGKGLKAMDLER